MKIQVHYSDCTMGIYENLQQAQEEILERHAEDVEPEYVQEINEDGDETGKVFGCTWSVKLVEMYDVIG